MKDRIPKYPGRVTLTPVEGQANTFDMIRADEPVQEGTPLNKTTLLTDETASLFGLGEDATVDEALNKTSGLYQHWWGRRSYAMKYVGSVGSALSSGVNCGQCHWEVESGNTTQYVDIYYYQSYSVNETTGKVSASGRLGKISFSVAESGSMLPLYGHYISKNGTVYYVPTSITSEWDFVSADDFMEYHNLLIKGLQPIVVTQEAGVSNDIEYVSSPDRNGYPDDQDDTYYYQYLGIPFDNAREGAKIETGSYVGTGTYGADNPNTLTFGLEPKLIALSNSDGRNALIYFGQTKAKFLARTLDYSSATSVPTTGSTAYASVDVVWSNDGKTVSWYSPYVAGQQYNHSGTTYTYVAIG